MKLKCLILSTILFFAVTCSFAQLTTIDFNSCNGSFNTNCNPIYANAYVCGNNVQLVNLFGSANFITYKKRVNSANTNAKALLVQSLYSNPFNSLSEAFSISKPFKKGKAYTIKIVASGQREVNSFSVIPDVRISLDKFAPSINNNCDLGDYNFPATSYLIDDYHTQHLDTLNNFQESLYTDSRYLIPGDDFDFLAIRAVPMSGVSQTGFLLHKIEIKQLNFQLQQSVSKIYCNTPVTQTLTLNNPDQINSVTSYTWNLGSTSNGWTYQGSPAPQIITTTYPVSSIQLIWNGGANPPGTNISVVPNVAGGPLNYSYSTSFTYTTENPPGLDLTGPNLIKTSVPAPASYSFINVPPGATVTWDQPQPNTFGTFTTNGTNAIFTPGLYASGSMKISGSVTNLCGITKFDTVSVSIKNACDELTSPSNLYTSGGTNGSITLGWDSRAPASYLLQYTVGGVASSMTAGDNFYVYYYGTTGVTSQFRVKAMGCEYPNPYESDWSEWKSFTTSTVPSGCNATLPTPVSAANSCGSSYLCGYAKYEWLPVSGATGYMLESITFNIITGQILPTQSFQFASSPNYGNYGNGLSGPGWVVKFRVRALCSATFSGWSSVFALN